MICLQRGQENIDNTFIYFWVLRSTDTHLRGGNNSSKRIGSLVRIESISYGIEGFCAEKMGKVSNFGL